MQKMFKNRFEFGGKFKFEFKQKRKSKKKKRNKKKKVLHGLLSGESGPCHLPGPYWTQPTRPGALKSGSQPSASGRKKKKKGGVGWNRTRDSLLVSTAR